MQSAPAPAGFEIGVTIADTYTIERVLGRGGMGMVLLATHKRLPDKRVAIKVLRAELASDELMARFKREAHIASRLAHPNIVHIEDFNVTPQGAPYLVLEYLEGETLAERLARGALTVEVAMAIARQVGSALAVAHARGVIHRDLKPGNIFLLKDDTAKVLDFGISKLVDSQTAMTQEDSLLGTPQYMAPEQATGQHGTIDLRSDVFSLGAIVYEMLGGKPAFAGLSVPEIVFKVVYEEPPPLPATVPPAVVDAIRRAMAKQAGERFASVAAFVEALTGSAIPVTLVSSANPGDQFAQTMASERVPKVEQTLPGRSRRWRVGAIAAVAAIAIAAAGTYAVMRGHEHTLDHEAMKSVAAQLLTSKDVEIDGQHHAIAFNTKHLRYVKFEVGGRRYEAIEQNPQTTSQWAELARQGKHVTQFKDLEKREFIGVIVDGEPVTEAAFDAGKPNETTEDP